MMLPPLFQHSTRTQSHVPSPLDQIQNQPTTPLATAPAREIAVEESAEIPALADELPLNDRKTRIKRLAALLLCGAIGIALFITWSGFGTPQQTSLPALSSQNGNLSSSQITTGTSANAGKGSAQNQADPTGAIQVYVIGAVKHPGVYTLPGNARIYQLIDAAGGTLSNANLALVNMAAKLSDGQEIYVARIGETPPSLSTGSNSSTSTTGQNTGGALLNINTASTAEMIQTLHVSSTTANRIVSYRQLHGNFSSVTELLQAVSSTIYRKIKDQVTV